jgi:hypothetical protein
LLGRRLRQTGVEGHRKAQERKSPKSARRGQLRTPLRKFGTYTQHVKHQQTPKDTSDRSGHGLSRVGGLAGGDGDDLCTEKGKRGGDRAGPEGEEVSPRSADWGFACVDGVERARTFGDDVSKAEYCGPRKCSLSPVTESNSFPTWTSSGIEDDTHQDQTDNGNDLDQREPEFHLSVDLDAEEVGAADADEADGDPDACGEG